MRRADTRRCRGRSACFEFEFGALVVQVALAVSRGCRVCALPLVACARGTVRSAIGGPGSSLERARFALHANARLADQRWQQTATVDLCVAARRLELSARAIVVARRALDRARGVGKGVGLARGAAGALCATGVPALAARMAAGVAQALGERASDALDTVRGAAVCVVRAGKGSKEEVKRPNASNAPMQ